jgi:hypothetical protein
MNHNKRLEEQIMTEKIKGLKNCKCIDMDCLPIKTFLTDIINNMSVEVLICPVCGGQIETSNEEED